MTDLEYLDFSHNAVSNISALVSLINIRDLWFNYNQVSDLLPLVNNPGIDVLDDVFIYGNPLSTQSSDEYIPTLLERGVRVHWDGE